MDRSANRLLQEMVRIPSVTGSEGDFAKALAGWCADAGLDVQLQEVEQGRPNVIARWDVGRRPVTVLAGHLDTVPVGEGWSADPFGGEVSNGRLIGRGACDMKGGLAAMLAAVFSIRARRLRPAGDVIIVATVGEEEDSAGIRQLVTEPPSADRAVLAEPTDLTLVRANRGLLNYRLLVKGASAHASTPGAGHNAVIAAAWIATELDALNSALGEFSHPAFGPPSLTVGTIHGGTRPYVVPDRCVIEIDRRVNPNEAPQEARHQIESVLSRARTAMPWLEWELDDGPEYLGFELEAEHPLVMDMASAMTVCGLKERVVSWPGASDAGWLVHKGQIPCVLFGPGSLRDAAHRPDEWVDLDDLQTAEQIYEHFLLGQNDTNGG